MSTHVFAPTFGSPFLAPAAPALARAASSAPAFEPDEASYALVRSGPPVPDHEVESAALAIEVTVRWGAQVLAVRHLARGASFRLGDGADFTLPEDVIGGGTTELVSRRGEAAVVLVPPSARAVVQARGAHPTEASGGEEIALAEGMRVTVEAFASRSSGTHGEPVAFEIATVRAGKVAPVGLMTALAGSALGFIGASFLGHAAVVASLATFMPAMSADDSEAIDRDQLLLMQKLLTASAERELEPDPDTAGPTGADTAGGGGDGARHAGEEGKAGKATPVATHGRMGFKGEDRESKLARNDELAFAREQGFVGFLSRNSRDPNAPASPWSTETYQGSDDTSALGDLFGQTIDDAAGAGGVGLNGVGEGGGGKGEGVGLNPFGHLGGGGHGKGWGLGNGDKDGIGNGHGKLPGNHVPKFSMRSAGVTETNGRLPAEVIQRIVRQNFGRMRLCYENGLRGNPGLEGRIRTRFVIGRDGAVAVAGDAGSDLPDQQVVQCVVKSFGSLTFPEPQGGVATVVYPLTLSPGG